METKIESKFRHCSELFSVRSILPEDVSNEYIHWLNDEENRKFLWIPEGEEITIHTQRVYVEHLLKSKNELLLGLFSEKKELIGTSGMQFVNMKHKHPAIGVLLGNQKYRGRGLGSAWIWMGTSILFQFYDAQKVIAGTLSINKPSINSFHKVGFKIEGTLRKQEYRTFCGWCDYLYLGCFRNEIVDAECLGIDDFLFSVDE